MRKLLKKVIPSKYTYSLVNLKKSLTGGFSQPTFSESAEDILILKFFKNQKKGFYVDVGAFHPKLLSNTHRLYQLGWHGLNIDPNPETISAYNRLRKRDVNIESGVAKETKELEYFSYNNAGSNTFDPSLGNRKAEGSNFELLEKKRLKCVPLLEVLNKHVPEGQSIDLMDVDVEGMDLEVLQSNDWDKYRPQLIVVEDRDFKTELEKSETYSYLYEKGYRFHSYLGITLMMADTTSTQK